jgi:hypothetical protein
LRKRIANRSHYDGDRPGGPLCLKRRLSAPRENDVNLQGHKVFGQLTEPLIASLRVPIFEADILVLDIAELSESLSERIDRRKRVER